MRLSDYFDEKFPTPEELKTLSREERLAKMRKYEACICAFLSDARDNPDVLPEQVTKAVDLLMTLVNAREALEEAQRAVEESQAALEQAEERVRLRESVISQRFNSLTTAELRGLMQGAKAQFGENSKDYQRLLKALRRFAPERVALALDT